MKRDYEREFRAEFPNVDAHAERRCWSRSHAIIVEGKQRVGETWKGWFVRWRTPYGLWACPDGSEVIFNRDYKPIWERSNGKVTNANPKEWVKFTNQQFFHHGTDKPRAALLNRLEKVLAAFKAGEDVRHHAANPDTPAKYPVGNPNLPAGK